MSNEEFEKKFEKKMELILEQQAQSAAKIGQLEDIVGRLANASLKRLEDTNEKIAALVDSQIRLAEAQNRTDESLRNLITVVDRYFSRDGRNGESQA
jgi:hypothetical protein